MPALPLLRPPPIYPAVVEQMAGSMERVLFFACVCLLVNSAWTEDPYRFFDWDITHGEISPLGVPQQVRHQSLVLVLQCDFIQTSVQSTKLWNGYHRLKFLNLASWKSLVMRFAFAFLQGILINGQFPGPTLECQTNDNLIINVRNSLPDPFLLSWYVRIHLHKTAALIIGCLNFKYQLQYIDRTHK